MSSTLQEIVNQDTYQIYNPKEKSFSFINLKLDIEKHKGCKIIFNNSNGNDICLKNYNDFFAWIKNECFNDGLQHVISYNVDITNNSIKIWDTPIVESA